MIASYIFIVFATTAGYIHCNSNNEKYIYSEISKSYVKYQTIYSYLNALQAEYNIDIRDNNDLPSRKLLIKIDYSYADNFFYASELQLYPKNTESNRNYRSEYIYNGEEKLYIFTRLDGNNLSIISEEAFLKNRDLSSHFYRLIDIHRVISSINSWVFCSIVNRSDDILDPFKILTSINANYNRNEMYNGQQCIVFAYGNSEIWFMDQPGFPLVKWISVGNDVNIFKEIQYEYFKECKIWFPVKSIYQRSSKGKIDYEEIIDIGKIAFNAEIPESRFEIKSLSLTNNAQVVTVNKGKNKSIGYWVDGLIQSQPKSKGFESYSDISDPVILEATRSYLWWYISGGLLSLGVLAIIFRKRFMGNTASSS